MPGPIGTAQIGDVQAKIIGPVRYTLQLGTVMERLVRFFPRADRPA